MSSRKPTLVATIGLPGSGKSTWAKEKVLEGIPGATVRVNRDSLRAMLHESRFGGTDTEPLVVSTRDHIIRRALAGQTNVICDDTNFMCLKELEDLAVRAGANFVVKDFRDVPLEVCLERNAARTGTARVPDHVIETMHLNHVARRTD